jgi:hypothetical protein
MRARAAGAFGAWVTLALYELGGVRSASEVAAALGADRKAVGRGLAAALAAGLVDQVHARGWRVNGSLSATQHELAGLNGLIKPTHAPNGSLKPIQPLNDDDDSDNDVLRIMREMYEREIGQLTEAVEDVLAREAVRLPDAEAWRVAFEAAAVYNVRKLAYVRTIARRYREPASQMRRAVREE